MKTKKRSTRNHRATSRVKADNANLLDGIIRAYALLENANSAHTTLNANRVRNAAAILKTFLP